MVIRDGDGWSVFSSPTQIVVTTVEDEVEECFRRAESFVEQGSWAAGFVAYDAGGAFDPAITCGQDGRPLVWFGVFDQPPKRYRELLPHCGATSIELRPVEWDEAKYTHTFRIVKDMLRNGDCYQLNLTMKQEFSMHGSAADFFVSRVGVKPPPYATYLHGGDWVVTSFSPELFFERRDDNIESHPMKGTVVRPVERAAEDAAAVALAADPKSRAENIMIVDMVRSDLGAVSDVGSVHVTDLLTVERHGRLLQMTSTVRARSQASTHRLFQSLFPPASVTGAPKVETCRWIYELEGRRGVYCGAIGFMSPSRQRFCVAIRTAWIDVLTNHGEFGIGSGIVWDSTAESEYAECLAKRDLLINEGEPWALVESLPVDRLDDPGVVEAHVSRMAASAEYFGIPFDAKAARTALAAVPRGKVGSRSKARLVLSAAGAVDVTVGPSQLKGNVVTARMATKAVNSADPNLRHKTTSRAVYDEALDGAPGVDEVLLFNERGELTEFCRGNVVLKLDGKLITPDPKVGCLAGIGVSRVDGIVYGRTTVDDVERAEAMYFVNSVTGMLRVELKSSG